MAQGDKYFQFPIAVMQRPVKESETGQSLAMKIVNAAIAHVARKMESDDSRWSEHQIQEFYISYISRRDVEASSDHQHFAYAAAECLNVNLQGNVGDITKLMRQAAPRGTTARLRTDIFWSMLKDDWNPNRIRALVAIYAGIGADQFKWLAWSRLCSLAAGFNKLDGLDSYWWRPSRSGLKHHIDQLWLHRNLFQMVQEGSGKRMKATYSNKHKDDRDLAKTLARHRELKQKNRKVKVVI